jgi:uncharacterized protein with WD repeat
MNFGSSRLFRFLRYNTTNIPHNPPKKLEIFRISEKNIPTESLDFEESIKGIFWEPNSPRFCLLKENKSPGKTDMMFYTVGGNKLELLTSFELATPDYNTVVWAPGGQYFIVRTLHSRSVITTRSCGRRGDSMLL